jgi:hypothetical protein
MAEYVQLDVAAEAVGRSEVTLRRLVKSGKVGHRKEKTLTGFIYQVDVDEIRRYYADAPEGATGDVKRPVVEEVKPSPDAARRSGGAVRVAVADAHGEMTTYWQARAELYENRYQEAVHTQASLREELGVWRGKAEQAQAIVQQLLPAQAGGGSRKTDPSAWLVWVLAAVTIIAGIGTIAFAAWAFFSL